MNYSSKSRNLPSSEATIWTSTVFNDTGVNDTTQVEQVVVVGAGEGGVITG